ncbi:MAG: lipocalin family protein [Bacteroidetes bacterium]|nr:lipocalin family protein [Bacteroidota bacterium]
MKNTILKSGILLIAMALVFAGCKKDENDDDNPQNSKTTSEYLTGGYWKVTAMSIDPGIGFGGVVITDFYSQMPPCVKDDLVKFNSDGSITDDEGATKCDVNDPQTSNDGTWVLSQDNQSVTVDYPDEDAITFTIIDLNDSTFKGSYTAIEDFGSGPLTYTYTITMTKQ